MITAHLVVLGKLKESYWQDAAAEYVKRLKPFANIIIHELKEESFKENDPPEMVKKKEAERIQAELAKIKDSYIFALDERGAQFSSIDFSKKLSSLTHSSSSFTFIIGGPLGLDRSITKQAHETLSFSSLTFTHQMIRVILLEQLYRAMMIVQNRKYHY